MAPIGFPDEFRAGQARYERLRLLLAGWKDIQRRRQERRTMVALSRLPPHLIRDMGWDPEKIYDALEGSWDEVHPARLQRFLPKDGCL